MPEGRREQGAVWSKFDQTWWAVEDVLEFAQLVLTVGRHSFKSDWHLKQGGHWSKSHSTRLVVRGFTRFESKR